MGSYRLLLEFFGEHWAGWMLSMSIQVALLGVIVWAITRLTPKSSASFRYVLWLLVFIKLVLPPSLSAPWSAVSLLDRVVTVDLTPLESRGPASQWMAANEPALSEQESGPDATTPVEAIPFSPRTMAMAVWLLGALGLAGTLTVQARRYARKVLRDLSPAPPELLSLAREIADRIRLNREFRLCLSPELKIPAVTGLWRPTVILPDALVDGMSREELSDILGHELAHVKRHDILFGWLTTLLLSVYWFHPVVWFAHFNLRREREMASDDTVLYTTRQEGRRYASTIIRMAENFDEAAPAGAGFLGILEIADNLLHRVRSAADATRPRYMGRTPAVALALLALLLLPMAAWTPATLAADLPPAPAAAAGPSAQAGPPLIVSSAPEHGATDVDPALKTIRITFDRDMAPGFSWTGGPPLFPETTGQSAWVDTRTCEMPVKLEAGKVYRLGINSKSHKNFRSTGGVPVRPRIVAFVTKGGDPSLADAIKAPKVVSMNPEVGASNVSPALDKLVVTFDREMGPGFSWTGGGEKYPETTGKPSWSEDRKTCTLPVKLKPNWQYRLGLNSPSHINFQSAFGIPLERVEWTFTTGQ